MRSIAARLRSAMIVSIVATAVSLPISASALDLPSLPPIDLPSLPNYGCGNGNGNGNVCPPTTTTVPEPVPTTVPEPVPTTVPVAPPTTVPVTSTTLPGGGPGTVPATVPVSVPATTLPVPPTPPPGRTTATTVADVPTTVPPVVPPTTVVTPVGPPPVGLGGFDTASMAPQMVGAMKMLESRDDEMVEDEPEAEGSTGPMSGGFHDLLSPVLPPALVDAVASPLVIMDALYDAFTSSGQALIVPGIAFLFGFGVPGLRRRITLDDAID